MRLQSYDDSVWLADPRAFAAQPVAAEEIPRPYRDWVLLETSVTAAIAEHLGGAPQVEVHFSGSSELLVWEAELVAVDRQSTQGFARHIGLSVGTKTVLWARTVVQHDSPVRSYLATLQTTPLGTLLFESPAWRRVSGLCPLATPEGLIGRAALWQDAETRGKLLVEEFFLGPLLSG